MKKIALIMLLCMLLSGCGTAPTFETLGNVLHEQEAVMQKTHVELPDGGENYLNEAGAVWIYGDYFLQIQAMESEDLDATVRAVCGFAPDELTVMTGSTAGLKRYEWVWTAMSEEGQMLCRAAILDDGTYHYCLTAMGPAELGNQLNSQWNGIFSSFSLQ